jgi:hypothetical protein
MVNPVRPRNLDKKSKLIFEFPQEVGKPTKRITLPFFENINISEKKKANYKKYNLLGRPSQLYTYTDSDSRRFSLEFHMSYLHILNEHGAAPLESFASFVDTENKLFQKLSFSRDSFLGKFGAALKRNSGWVRNYSLEAKRRFSEIPEEPRESEALTNVLNGIGSLVDGALGVVSTVRDNTPILNLLGGGGPVNGTQDATYQYNRAMNLVIYWTQIIRASVCNNSQNPIYGPPVVRLLHGSLFNDIPCICTNYTMSPVEEAGYDSATMLPRRIKYSMSLEEIRAGDYQKYELGDIVKRDNVVGWEAVIDPGVNSLDPGALNSGLER